MNSALSHQSFISGGQVVRLAVETEVGLLFLLTLRILIVLLMLPNLPLPSFISHFVVGTIFQYTSIDFAVICKKKKKKICIPSPQLLALTKLNHLNGLMQPKVDFCFKFPNL